MKYILFPEGRILNNNGAFEYEYHLKDHLGSVRVVFVPTVNGKEVVQENAYYPFGATIGDLSYAAPLNNNRYGYTNQEQLNDFNLNWYDYIARNYNPLIGRFNSIDPLAEKYYGISPYAYCNNNPVRFVDPTGMFIDEWRVNLETGTLEWMNNNGGNQTQTIHVTDNNGGDHGSYAIPGNKFDINHTNDNGNISLDINGGNEYNFAVLGMSYSTSETGNLVPMPRLTGDDMTIPSYMNFKAPSGGAWSVGGSFFFLFGVSVEVGFAKDGLGNSAPFANFSVGVGLELGIGGNYTRLPAGTGLSDFDGSSGSINVSAGPFSVNTSTSGNSGGGVTYGAKAGMSFRGNLTVVGSWAEMGDYYSKFGHIKR